MLHKKKNRRKVTSRKTGRKPVAGVGWYSSGQWQQLREVAADPERLEKTYQEWLVVADQACQKMEASGIAIVKVPVDVQGLIDWCRERNLPIDGKARARYVVEVMKRGALVSKANGERLRVIVAIEWQSTRQLHNGPAACPSVCNYSSIVLLMKHGPF